jgi:hypothetical protein
MKKGKGTKCQLQKLPREHFFSFDSKIIFATKLNSNHEIKGKSTNCQWQKCQENIFHDNLVLFFATNKTRLS